VDDYLEYYKISRSEFDEAIDKYANKDLFEKVEGFWQPRFIVT
jgi:hypothetical protein